MLHEQPFPHRLGKHAQRYDHAQHTGEHDGVFHRALPSLRSHLVGEGREDGFCPRDRHSPLIPFAIASQSSWIFGRNKVMATIAITTSTHVSEG